jgi:SagB-type dehydrogenase family enzyme
MWARSNIVLLTFLLGVGVALCWASSGDIPKAGPQDEIRLPAPQTTGGMSLAEALAKRRSQRSFQDKPLSAAQISQLCWAAQGITEPERGHRTAPSAKALYPIHVFVVDKKGTWEYSPKNHGLIRTAGLETFDELKSAIGQSSVRTAPVFMVLAMEPAILETKLPKGAERYSFLEAGHVAQNVLLQATAVNLVSVPIGGIDEDKVAAALDLPAGQRPVYVLPLGYSSEQR